jgi:peptidoglycan/xylan/chitin deacetylase (PgdA/CDA1 family)
MRIPGIKTAKTFSRWVQARIHGGALILGYHRVTDVLRDDYEVCISPVHFEEQMEQLSRHANPIRLSYLVECLKAGAIPPRSVAVTFDDGYADNLYQAKPILEKFGVPATVFVCTGYSGKEFWWDELTRLVRSKQAGLHELTLQAGENRFQWNQLQSQSESDSIEIRTQFLQSVYRFILSLDIDDQNNVMEQIRKWSSLASGEMPSHRGMTNEELLKLTKDGLIDLGAHSRYHPILTRLTMERQKDEIVSSKKDLEDLLGKHIAGFAYPNGNSTILAKKIVQEIGFAFACTSYHDVIRPGIDLYELTRFWQQNVNGDKFMKRLQLWMQAYRN